jgi:hypothetical protein
MVASSFCCKHNRFQCVCVSMPTVAKESGSPARLVVKEGRLAREGGWVVGRKLA